MMPNQLGVPQGIPMQNMQNPAGQLAAANMQGLMPGAIGPGGVPLVNPNYY
jgi:hypothetical protein